MMAACELKLAAAFMGAKLTGEVEPLLVKARERLSRAAVPGHVWRRVSIRAGDEGLWADELFLPGRSIQAHLHGLKEGLLLAATLGAQVDMLIRQESVVSIARGAAVSACASAMIEGYLDSVCTALAGDCFLTSRFSPGYGDLPLFIQPALLNALSAHTIGLYVTNGFMLVPEKSVTAVLGLTHEPVRQFTSHCSQCDKDDCSFREVQE